MNVRRPQIGWKVAALAAAVALLTAAAAVAGVRVYSNDFSNRAVVKDLRVSGKGCKKSWNRKREQLRVIANNGPVHCRVTLPVQGDSSQPDHTLDARVRVAKPQGSTKKASSRRVRRRQAKRDKRIYAGIAVRDGSGGRYEARVYPGRRGFELRRVPEIETGDFPVKGRDGAIGRFDERNVLLLEAIIDSVRAKFNKKRIGATFDPAAKDLDGRRLTLLFGSEGRTNNPIRALFDDVRVSVPSP